MVHRLQKFMNKLISANQSAFIKGRLISDNILVAHECIHFLKNKRHGGSDLALKLYMSKTYDRVEWSFVWFIMRKLGFCQRWINWMQEYVSTVSFLVIVDGHLLVSLNQKGDFIKEIPFLPIYFCFVQKDYLMCSTRLNRIILCRDSKFTVEV